MSKDIRRALMVAKDVTGKPSRTLMVEGEGNLRRVPVEFRHDPNAVAGAFGIDEGGQAYFTHKHPQPPEKITLQRAVQKYLAPFGEDTYVRSTNNEEDYNRLKAGTHRGSINHATGEPEGGISASHDAEFGSKYAYLLKGTPIGVGTDQEPLLDTKSAKPISPLMPWEKFSQLQHDAAHRRSQELGLSPEDRRTLASAVYIKPDITKARGGSVHPASQIPGVHISERIHGKPIFTEEREGRADGGTVFPDQTQADEGITAYQGGPHSVGPEGYSNDKIGTGEGAAAYGHGHYFAEAEPVAQGYRERLSSYDQPDIEHMGARFSPGDLLNYADPEALHEEINDATDALEDAKRKAELEGPNSPWHRSVEWMGTEVAALRHMAEHGVPALPRAGHMHEVRIKAKPEHLLDWDKPLSEQSDHVQGAVNSLSHFTQRERETLRIRTVYERLGTPKEASERLSGAGVRGIRYLDQHSRNAGKGSRNYVVFDPKHIDIQRRYARGGMAYADGGSLPDPDSSKITAYHASPRRLSEFKPSQARGATFFAPTPEGAVSGAGAGASDMTKETSTRPGGQKYIHKTVIDPKTIRGLHYNPEEIAWFHSLPKHIDGDDELMRIANENKPNPYIHPEDVYEGHPNSARDRFFYVKKDSPPSISYKDAIDTGQDVYGRQHPHYAPEGDEARSAQRVLSEGMKGWLVHDEGGLSVAMADPSEAQIKEVTAHNPAKPRGYADGGSLPDAGVQKALNLTRDLNPQGLYSHAAEAALASPQAKGPLPQMLASLKGVKPDELKYSGVNEQFAGQPRVTREELAQHFQQGLPNIQETTLREGGNEGPTKFSSYTMPGGENYREILLHLPDHSATPKFIDEMTPGELRGFIAREDRNADFDGLDHDQLKNLAASIVGPDATEAHGLAKAQHSVADVHYNSHWPKHNVLAHLRLKDRTGPNGEKILHAEEVQSDWGQDARRAGTYDAIRPYQVFETNTGKVLSEHATPEEAQVESAKHRAAGHEGVDFGHAIDTHTDKEPVPNGPYIGSTQGWTDLALKRLLHEAATGGYDKVVYTPGAEQGRRYNEVQQAESMKYYPESQMFHVKHPHAMFSNGVSGLSKEELIKRFGRENIERLFSQPLNEDKAHELHGNLEYGGEGMKGYYDKIVPKSLLDLAKQHDPNAKLETHPVREESGVGYNVFRDGHPTHPYRLQTEDSPNVVSRHQNPDEAWEEAARLSGRELPGLTITPRMRESILKKGFKAYARGGDVEGFKDGGSPDDDLVRQRLAAIPSVTHPDPEMVQKALAIAAKTHAVTPKYDPKAGQSYYNFNTPTDISDVQSTVDPIPGVTPLARQEKSWEDLYKEGKGGTMINLGGDRSRLGRLTHIQGKALAWPVDLHAGPDYMREPNEGAVWANAANQSGRINKLITRLQDKGPVYGAYTPMGPKTVDSSVQMSDALMSQIAAQKPDRKMMKEFDAQLRAGFFADKPGDRPAAAEAMKGWPGIEKAKEARDFLAKLPGTLRSLIVKHMDKAGWHKAGFPHVGMTRVAFTDPELLKTSGNMVGHRIVQISADDISPSAFKHNTYPEVTAGKYVGDVPLVQRHYAFPEAVERFAQTPHTPGVLHPYSENPNARGGFKKMTEEQKVTQTLDEPWMERLSEGLANQKKYGLSKGGTVKDRSVVDDALRLTSKIRPAAAKRR